MTEPEHACSYCDPYNFAAYPPPDEERRERCRVHGTWAVSEADAWILFAESLGWLPGPATDARP